MLNIILSLYFKALRTINITKSAPFHLFGTFEHFNR